MKQNTATGNLTRASEGNRRTQPDLGVVTVLRFLHFIVVVYFFFDRLELDGTYRDNFEVAAAFRAGDDFALVNLVFLDIQIGLTFGAINHNGLHLNNSAPVNI